MDLERLLLLSLLRSLLLLRSLSPDLLLDRLRLSRDPDLPRLLLRLRLRLRDRSRRRERERERDRDLDLENISRVTKNICSCGLFISPGARPLSLLAQPDLAAIQLGAVQLVKRPLHVRPRAELHDALQ